MRFKWRRPERPTPGEAASLTGTEIEQSDDPIYLITDRLISRVHARPADQQVEYVRSLSPGERMMWGVFMVDSEVNNGGFNQFFWNSSRDYVEEAREGLRLIGAEEQLRLLDEAVARFERHFERLRPYFERNTVEAFSGSYDEKVFDDLDDRYTRLDTYDRLAEYIRGHVDEFTGQV